MTKRSNLSEQQRLELICESIRYCQRVRDQGMVMSAWTKALREPIHFMWACRNGGKKGAARLRSVAAGLRSGMSGLVYDHAIPFGYLQAELMEVHEPTPEAVRWVLNQWLVCCWITRDENRKLGEAGLSKKMPADWDGCDPLARYKRVSIETQANPDWHGDG